MTKSHTGRFVRSAWTLLSFQFVASVGAVAVTGTAALYVSRLAAELEATRAAPEAVEEAALDPSLPTGTGSETATELPTEGPTESLVETPTEPAPAIAACGRSAVNRAPTIARAQVNAVVFRVPANAEWCDTGLAVQQGQTLTIRAQGRWHHQGAPEYGPDGRGQREAGTLYPRVPQGALLGRIGERPFPIGDELQLAAADSSALQLSMNDVPGRFADNQGFVDVSVQIAPAAALQ